MAPDDPFEVARVRGMPETYAGFNAAGVLAPVDVHAATTLTGLVGERGAEVWLAVALAVRAPRLSHVCADLSTVRDTVTADADQPLDLDTLPWPADVARWRAQVAASTLVQACDGDADRPLRLVGTRLYLDRYWRYEQRVVDALRERAARAVAGLDPGALRAALDRCFGAAHPDVPDLQRLAAATAVLRHLSVVAGGPGTGKTTTVTRILAVLAELAAGGERPRVALAAPTGKAAQRMTASLADSVDGLDPPPATREWLLGFEAVTLHRLLGQHPGNRTRFRHDGANPLPHDVVIVDETSMVSLSLMAKLLDAVRPDARLVLVGDPEQLASVESGAVLGDIVGPAGAGLRMREPARRALAEATGSTVPATDPGPDRIGDGTVVLRRVHRFGEDSGIAALAAAIQAGDDDAVVEVLGADRHDVGWVPELVEASGADERLRAVRERIAAVGRELLAAARVGHAVVALPVLDRLRVLCAHRRGPYGVASWVPLLERWLAEDVHGFATADAWYVGRPVLVTRNDYQVGVLNGDVGVTIAQEGGGVTVAFPQAGGVRLLSPSRLEHVETVHAMTVHKGQGSQFGEVVVVLPSPESAILTRELLYTAATRAQRALTIVGSEASVRAAVARRIQRASGLREALWGAVERTRQPEQLTLT